ncbi:hypothetical protein GMORB2_7044 [Geosmithia morbida]|uniref:Heparan-alpha-glucosaminide N-acetyltransferase catalytic domain-containing protein n=1 Tax=Geosmithia morbida TaxID=1094350 RepID=A0A9P4YVT9_9HYPO|nr:uncharacterized protein GMORB2_7044 [Geosmithia morbida]KAF4122737.1 hypothetical protein GMORB2_7044 [Geosmithia morbida]
MDMARHEAAVPRKQKQQRQDSVRAIAPDLVRGLLMILMAIDHVTVMLRVYPHSTTDGSEEADSTVVHGWNRALAYTLRTLSHLCGAGFPFLMGMGVVFSCESRLGRLGWSAARLSRYLAVRAALLAIVVPVLMAVVLAPGRMWFFNMVLSALGFGYLLAGLLCIGMRITEDKLASVLLRTWPAADENGDEGAAEPLLGRREGQHSAWAQSVSWHAHNATLVMAGAVTIWWNVWFSPTSGHCDGDTAAAGSRGSPWFLRMWIWVVEERYALSTFPPLAWLSFAILGLLYGRVLAAGRCWSRRCLVAGYAAASVVFAAIFVLTRVLRTGNLSEGCLQTPEHVVHPGRNPYLTSVESFFYVVKYPPDVAYWSLTMCGNLLLLAAFEAVPRRAATSRYFTVLLDLGRSAFAFYVVHLFVLMAGAAVLLNFFGRDTGLPDPLEPGKTARGITSIPAFLAVIAATVLIMWPFCRWWARFKAQRGADSIWRLF